MNAGLVAYEKRALAFAPLGGKATSQLERNEGVHVAGQTDHSGHEHTPAEQAEAQAWIPWTRPPHNHIPEEVMRYGDLYLYASHLSSYSQQPSLTERMCASRERECTTTMERMCASPDPLRKKKGEQPQCARATYKKTLYQLNPGK